MKTVQQRIKELLAQKNIPITGMNADLPQRIEDSLSDWMSFNREYMLERTTFGSVVLEIIEALYLEFTHANRMEAMKNRGEILEYTHPVYDRATNTLKFDFMPIPVVDNIVIDVPMNPL